MFIENKKVKPVLACTVFLIMPILSFYFFEMISGNIKMIWQNGRYVVLLNVAIWYLIYLVVFILCNHVKYTVICLNLMSYILAVANAFVVQFRSQPIMVMDLHTLMTALTVAGEYEYHISYTMVWVGIIVFSICILMRKIDYSIPKLLIRISVGVLVIVCSLGLYSGITKGTLLEKAGVEGLNFFKFSLSYETDGYALCTVETIKYLKAEKPDGYSIESVKAIENEVGNNYIIQQKKKLPENIIVIMNESFSDLKSLGDIQISEPITPFIDSLEENTVKGNLYMSVFGGSTANSEFEFLTGNSVAYIPSGTVAYQMYVRDGDSSMVQIMKENGYHTIAFHPYIKSNYNRKKVYQYYGFDEFVGKDDIEIQKLRKYESDEADYNSIIEMYENKGAGEKLFVFNVTMQNHAGYDYKDYESTISITNAPGEYPQAEQFLSLIKESDTAFQHLLNYFSQVDEDTVILLFGDHQPQLEDGFYDFIMGPATDENYFDLMERKQVTPYVLWANYDLNASEKENLSANFLGSYMMNTIGFDLPVYNRFLLEFQNEIPAMNLYGYMNSEGNMIWNGTPDENVKIWMDKYHILQYNNLFDHWQRQSDIFE